MQLAEQPIRTTFIRINGTVNDNEQMDEKTN